MNHKKVSGSGQRKRNTESRELSISIIDSRQYCGVSYWCSPDGLCELPMDCGTACGSDDLLRDMIDVDAEGFQ